VYTPDDLMGTSLPPGDHVVLFDDDHYYMGGVLAELLRGGGRRVTLVTPAATVSAWSDHTMEQHRVQARLLDLGVEVATSTGLVSSQAGGVRLACTYTGSERELECDALLLVTGRLPLDGVAAALAARADAPPSRAVGDAFSPGTIAAAVWEVVELAEAPKTA